MYYRAAPLQIGGMSIQNLLVSYIAGMQDHRPELGRRGRPRRNIRNIHHHYVHIREPCINCIPTIMDRRAFAAMYETTASIHSLIQLQNQGIVMSEGWDANIQQIWIYLRRKWHNFNIIQWNPSKVRHSDGPSCIVIYSKVSTVQGFQCIEAYGDIYVWDILNCPS